MYPKIVYNLKIREADWLISTHVIRSQGADWVAQGVQIPRQAVSLPNQSL